MAERQRVHRDPRCLRRPNLQKEVQRSAFCRPRTTGTGTGHTNVRRTEALRSGRFPTSLLPRFSHRTPARCCRLCGERTGRESWSRCWTRQEGPSLTKTKHQHQSEKGRQKERRKTRARVTAAGRTAGCETSKAWAEDRPVHPLLAVERRRGGVCALVVAVGPPAHSSASWVVPGRPPVVHLRGRRGVSRLKNDSLGQFDMDLVGSAVRHRAESLGDPRDQGSGGVAPSTGVAE